MTDEQKAAQRANLEKARAARKERLAAAKAAEPAAETEPVEEVFERPVAAEGGVYVGPEDEAEEAAPVETVELTPFQRFVLSLDPETRDLLDDEQLAGIWQEQQAKARAEKAATAKKRVTERALQAARIAEGVIAPASATEIAWKERMAEPVEFTIHLPVTGGIAAQGFDVGPVDVGLRIDNRIFLDGHKYTMMRAQFDSYRDILYRANQNELAFEGKGLMRRMSLVRSAMSEGGYLS